MSRVWCSRRAALGALLVAFALVAAACDSSTQSATDAADTTAATTTSTAATTTVAPDTTAAASTAAPTTTEAPGRPYGGEAVVADDKEPPTLNPFVPGGNTVIGALIGQAYLAGVYEIDGFTQTLTPELVTELPTGANGGVTINADGTMTVRYNIRDNAKWSDGVPISGDDFQFTLDTILDPVLRLDTSTYDTIVSTVVGPKTFDYTLSAPTVLYELIFDVIIPKHAVEGSDFVRDWNDTMWPSAGPFVFDQWEKGDFIRLVRNENYWKTDGDTGQQLPYLDSVIFRFIPETESIITSFRSREVDIIQPAPEAIEILQSLESEGVVVEVLSGPIWEHLNFQFDPARFAVNPDSINGNLNYRKAVAHTIDKQLIVEEILGGHVEPLYSFIDLYTPALSQQAWRQYDYNVEKAKEFAAAAKAETGLDTIRTVFTTTSNNDERVRLSELLVTMFTDVGIEYENMLQDSQFFIGETLDNGQWDLGEWAYSGSAGFSGLISSFDVFDPESPCPKGANCYRYGSEGSDLVDADSMRIAEIIDLLHSSVDPDVLIPLINEGENILADNVVLIPLYARLATAAVWGDEIGGHKHNATSAGHTWNMEHWYRVDL